MLRTLAARLEAIPVPIPNALDALETEAAGAGVDSILIEKGS